MIHNSNPTCYYSVLRSKNLVCFCIRDTFSIWQSIFSLIHWKTFKYFSKAILLHRFNRKPAWELKDCIDEDIFLPTISHDQQVTESCIRVKLNWRKSRNEKVISEVIKLMQNRIHKYMGLYQKTFLSNVIQKPLPLRNRLPLRKKTTFFTDISQPNLR